MHGGETNDRVQSIKQIEVRLHCMSVTNNKIDFKREEHPIVDLVKTLGYLLSILTIQV